MRYIKTFEGLFDFFKKKNKKELFRSPKEILYSELNNYDFNEFANNHDSEKFSKKEIDYLYKVDKYAKLVSNSQFHIQKMNKDFSIYKYQDEYFLILLGRLKKYEWNYYKCDSFDGVIQFFKNNI